MARIKTFPVTSSNIKAIGYDSAVKLLQVDFKNGTSYQYADVPPEVVTDLMCAASVGSFLAKSIKPKFAASKLEDEA